MSASTLSECRVFTPMPGHVAGLIADQGNDVDALWGKDYIDKGRQICGWK